METPTKVLQEVIDFWMHILLLFFNVESVKNNFLTKKWFLEKTVKWQYLQ